MSTDYKTAPDVRRVAQRLIAADFPRLRGLRIEYVFAEKTPKRHGAEVWGLARKIGSLSAFLAGALDDQDDGTAEEFFCVVISQPVWAKLDDLQKEALVFHELCHFGVEEDENGDSKLSILPHDLEEFGSVVKRYGLWREDVRAFLDAANNTTAQGRNGSGNGSGMPLFANQADD